ncbi:Mediator complex subunit Med22 [Penicillium concentricum]|uniref:Mediator complex subunit Med22 n=1 Tax=Penicillium concentricum TaxID=293559 RepID=A0A9W9V2K0_9EURO|nr:Mediator complex subunit Med22 [Penicillium concentricum]KAJ5365364.1 Mediator complex subunit Med22 [Penicillium concentricum]
MDSPSDYPPSDLSSSSSEENNKNVPTMDSRPTAKELLDRVDYDISQLLQRFENIVAIAANKFDGTSHVDAAVEAFQIDVESTALIRAAEDLLALSRLMKELWLFGKLDTLGEDERDVQRREKLEGDVEAIRQALEGGLLMPYLDGPGEPEKPGDTEQSEEPESKDSEQAEKPEKTEQ